ncbi:MAG: Uncharacterized protein XD76_0374 [candidate division TA06 bacterium 32_111]|uniref:DUF2062 domain-containing protein n=2 Tax=Bacteria candidate phyla TaxID=1783234 RepID=A0A101I2T4_UNCT6|nr:MAG: Uncharacterized protein XD76_0374 [candidate division TA06 bacterium 32_111]KUK87593.1 MAG: Uncharacterized protein XE03_0484 [candidate division TA06 bacterium 34_109]HAF07432.1 hypothetical protein [candidate division WOR-3 bacterium]HCP17501.1 hypothetical protein [candidate division WOR-3 bacterium]
MFRKFNNELKNLIYSNLSADQIANGFAVGVFIGFLPLYGFQTVLSIVAALIFKNVNRISLVTATQLFLPPVIPIVVFLNYLVGSLILYRKILFLKLTSFEDIIIYIKPIFIGSLFVGFFFAILSKYIIKFIVIKLRRKDDK